MLIQPPDAMDEVMLTSKKFAENCPYIHKIIGVDSITYNGYEKSFWFFKRILSVMKVERIKDRKFINYDSCDDNYFTVKVYMGESLVTEQITNYKFANNSYKNLVTEMYASHGLGNPLVSKTLDLYGYLIKDVEKLIKKP